MPKLRIDLQDGFRNDAVIIRADGTEIYHRDGVNSTAAVSHADSFETDWSKWPVRIEIDVTTRGMSGVVELAGPACLGVSVHPQGELIYRISREPFLYF